MRNVFWKLTKSQKIKGRLSNTIIYILLISLSFVYLAAFFYMLGHSIMSVDDWQNENVKWLPHHIVLENYKYAFRILNYEKTLLLSLGITLLATFGQVITCSFVGYGLARIKFKGSAVAFLIIIFTMIIPPQTIIVPQFLLISKLGMVDTYLPIIVPCFFAMGLNGGMFIFIFKQFFKGMPSELENAALIDGAGVFGAYFRIMLPNASSAVLVSSILSLVWQWNNAFEPSIYIRDSSKATLSLSLSNQLFQNLAAQTNTEYNKGVVIASTVLIVLPVIVIFFIMQKRFMQSIETSGLAN